jgi:translation initiation factor 3 subunit I
MRASIEIVIISAHAFQRPILLKGHERSITHIKYNNDGDLLFSSSKHNFPCVWNAQTGERIGTYDGHNGAVWYLDVNGELNLAHAIT